LENQPRDTKITKRGHGVYKGRKNKFTMHYADRHAFERKDENTLGPPAASMSVLGVLGVICRGEFRHEMPPGLKPASEWNVR
jgi:hypothetical protein